MQIGDRLARLEGDDIPPEVLSAAFAEWKRSPAEMPSARTLRIVLDVEAGLVEMHLASMPSHPAQLQELRSDLAAAIALLDAGQAPDEPAVASIWRRLRALRGAA